MSALETVKLPLRRLRAEYRQLTGTLRGFPSALIIGTQKGGTTFLFDYLVQHPDVLPPLNKEIHYFDLNYARGVTWYRARFPYSYQLRGRAMTLDASPYYLAHPLVPQRVTDLPGAAVEHPGRRGQRHAGVLGDLGQGHLPSGHDQPLRSTWGD